MTAREFLDRYRFDSRLVTGDFFPQAPVSVQQGDTVGVVLLNHGGPRTLDEVGGFLYARLMDPAALELPLPAWLRDPICRFTARLRTRQLEECYRQIGGTAPVNRLVGEQAAALAARLNERFAPVTGATFRTYVAMRYGQPSAEAAVAQMAADGVSRVVLLPLYPQYSKSTTGSALGYWKALEEAGEAPSLPASLAYEYAAHPLYVQALSDRIDEALQRFPRAARERVHLVFSARGTAARDLTRRRDPYCCLVHTTVQAVMDLRAAREQRPFEVSFLPPLGPGEALGTSTRDSLEALANRGVKSVLVVPVGFVTDHLETAYTLDIATREEADQLGLEHFEVASGLNCHPLFIEALAEVAAAQIEVAMPAGDGAASLPASIASLPRFSASVRTVRCAQCERVCEAHDWSRQAASASPDAIRLATARRSS